MKKPAPQSPKKEFEKYAFLPKVIRLGYQDIKVLEIESIDDTQGSYSPDSHTIKIKSEIGSREKLNTLLHELLHACISTYGLKCEFGDDDKEEKIVNALGNGLTEVLVRNKELVEFINKSI